LLGQQTVKITLGGVLFCHYHTKGGTFTNGRRRPSQTKQNKSQYRLGSGLRQATKDAYTGTEKKPASD
jgi:hypothetical protein